MTTSPVILSNTSYKSSIRAYLDVDKIIRGESILNGEIQRKIGAGKFTCGEPSL